MKLTRCLSILDKVIFYSVLFLLAFIPLYPKFPLFNVKGTFVAVRIEDLLIAFTLVIWLIFMILKYMINFKVAILVKNNLYRAMTLFFLIGILSLFSALFLTKSIELHLGLLHFFRRIEFMMFLPICATIFNNRKRLILALIILFFTIILINIYALGQQYLDLPVISTTNSEFSKGQILRLTPGARLNSTFAGHYDLAVYLAAVLTFLLSLLFAVKMRWKIAIFALFSLSLFVLILTAARVSFIAAFLGLIFTLIISGKKKYLALILIFLALIAIYPSELRDRYASTITVNFLNLGQRYEGRNLNQQLENKLNIPTLSYKMASRSALAAPFATAEAGIPVDIAPGEPINETQLGVYRSFQIRLNIEWPRAIKAFAKNPFLGTGYSSLGIATDNDYLRSLGEVGILGTIAFALILLSIWKKLMMGIRKEEKLIKYFSIGNLSMIVVFLSNGLFIDVFEASKIAAPFWMMIGLSLGALESDEYK